MLEMYFVSFGVAVRPICVADEKYSRISRQAESSDGAAAMALVDHYEVEEVGRELPVELLIAPLDR